MDREAWRAAIHGVAKSRTWLGDWTELNKHDMNPPNAFRLLAAASFKCTGCWHPESVCGAHVSTKSLQLCLTLCDPTDCSLPIPSVHGILQARILEWAAIPFSRGSSWLRDLSGVSWIGRWILYHLSHQGSPILSETIPKIPSILQNVSHLCVVVLDAETCCTDICLNYLAWSSYVGGKCMTSVISFHSQWGNGGLERFASFLKIAQLFPSEDRTWTETLLLMGWRVFLATRSFSLTVLFCSGEPAWDDPATVHSSRSVSTLTVYDNHGRIYFIF